MSDPQPQGQSVAAAYPHSPETYRSKLSWEQLNMLLRPVDRNRVGHANGQSNMEAYDIRAHLDRLFGFANWDGETVAMELIGERWGEKQPRGGGQPYRVVTVAYRAHYVLRVRATDGELLATYSEWAMGDAINFSESNWGKAHDFAIKTAESQAFKRCAINLGDQFGLSLYRGGSLDPVVGWTMNQTHDPHAEQPQDQMPTDRSVPDVVAETDPDTGPAPADEGVWQDRGPARDQARPQPREGKFEADEETVDLRRARQDNAAEASQTRPHPNSREPETVPPGSQTHLAGEQILPPGQSAPWEPTGPVQQGAQWRRMSPSSPPRSRGEWVTAWMYYASWGSAAFHYFIGLAMNRKLTCPDEFRGLLQPAHEQLLAAEKE